MVDKHAVDDFITSPLKDDGLPPAYHQPMWLKVLGPGLGILAAIGTAYSRISDEFYSKIKRQFGVQEMSQERYKIKDDLVEAKLRNHPDGDIYEQELKKMKELRGKLFQQIEEGKFSDKAFDKTTTELEKAYTQSVKNISQAMGYDRGLVRNSWMRLHELGSTKRTNIIATAAISAGAAFGAFFVLNQNRRLRHELTDIHGRLDKQQAAVEEQSDKIIAKVAEDNHEQNAMNVHENYADPVSKTHNESPHTHVQMQDAQHSMHHATAAHASRGN